MIDSPDFIRPALPIQNCHFQPGVLHWPRGTSCGTKLLPPIVLWWLISPVSALLTTRPATCPQTHFSVHVYNTTTNASAIPMPSKGGRTRPTMTYCSANSAGQSDLGGVRSPYGTVLRRRYGLEPARRLYLYRQSTIVVSSKVRFTVISSGGLRTDGTAVCWGWQEFGQASES